MNMSHMLGRSAERPHGGRNSNDSPEMDHHQGPKIPPRWLHCPRKSTVINGKFIAFKTPLDSRYDSQVPEACRHSIEMLFDYLKASKVKLGMIVDLTQTKRYYNPNVLEQYDCKYLKLECRGHSETPDRQQTTAFINVCHNFIQQRPLEIIGVHCTHGCNRTGFLICAYLVEKLNWGIDAALKVFSECRPPGIYKQDYIDELYGRYGDAEDTPTAPPLPSWCTECDDTVDDDGEKVHPRQSANRKVPHKRRAESIKKNAEFMEGVQGVTQVTEPLECGEVQSKVQAMCNWKGKGFPGSQPVSMDIENVNKLTTKRYKVSWKADGMRYLLLIDGDQAYMLDRDNSVFKLPNIQFPRRKDPARNIENTLADGEMIVDSTQELTRPRFLIYDIIKFEGQDVGMTDFDRRLLCIDKEIIGPRQAKMQKGQINHDAEPFGIRSKPFWDVDVSRKLLEGRFSRELSHEIDGLIFQPFDDPYTPGRCMDVLKWKPPDLNSVDFKLKLVKENRPGMLHTTKALLFVGGLDAPMAEMKYTKDLKELDNKIIECCWDFGTKQWKFMRQRTDKSFPNAYSTAMGVCNSLRTPVTKDILFDRVENHAYRPAQSRHRHHGMPPPK